MNISPQVLISVDVKSKPEISSNLQITKVINEVEKRLAEKGRVLIRYSGTQPLCRIMVEGPTLELTEKWCRDIANKVKEQIG